METLNQATMKVSHCCSCTTFFYMWLLVFSFSNFYFSVLHVLTNLNLPCVLIPSTFVLRSFTDPYEMLYHAWVYFINSFFFCIKVMWTISQAYSNNTKTVSHSLVQNKCQLISTNNTGAKHWNNTPAINHVNHKLYKKWIFMPTLLM